MKINDRIATAVLATLAFAFPHISAGQTAPANTPEALLNQLAAPMNMETSPIRPWHLRIAFELYDLKGEHSEAGTIEELSVSPTDRTIIVSSPSYNSSTSPSSSSRALFSREAFLTNLLREQVVGLVPDFSAFPALTVVERPKPLDSNGPRCFLITRLSSAVPLPNDHGTSPEFCFSGNPPLLVARYETGDLSVNRSSWTNFKGVSVPRTISISIGNLRAIEGRVTLLEPYPSGAYSTPAPSSTPTVAYLPDIAENTLGVQKKQPVYPSQARQNRLSGTVILAATISSQGTVEYLDVVSSPDESFSKSAIDAATQWKYQPFEINGIPVTVNTTISINYKINTATKRPPPVQTLGHQP